MRKKASALLISAAMLLLAACETITPISDPGNEKVYAEFAMGTWEQKVYSSEWLNITFTRPDGLIPMSAEELKAEITSEAYLYNDPAEQTDSKALNSSGVYYELALKDANGICSLILCVENAGKTVGSDFVSADTYINTTKSKVKENAILPYDFSENTEAEIAGTKYICFSAYNSYITNTYYITKYENMFATWVSTEYVGQPASPKALIDSVKELIVKPDNTQNLEGQS